MYVQINCNFSYVVRFESNLKYKRQRTFHSLLNQVISNMCDEKEHITDVPYVQFQRNMFRVFGFVLFFFCFVFDSNCHMHDVYDSIPSTSRQCCSNASPIGRGGSSIEVDGADEDTDDGGTVGMPAFSAAVDDVGVVGVVGTGAVNCC